MLPGRDLVISALWGLWIVALLALGFYNYSANQSLSDGLGLPGLGVTLGLMVVMARAAYLVGQFIRHA